MTIEQQIRDQLKDAMRNKDKARLDALRAIETEVTRAKTEPGFSGEVDDALYLKVLGAYVKKMNKARQEYLKAGERGAEMAEQLAFEVEFLGQWLPQKMDEAATRALIKETIESLGVSDASQAGRVMGQIMKGHRDEVDGSLVNKLVREMLA